MEKRKIIKYIIGSCVIGMAIFLVGIGLQLGQSNEIGPLALDSSDMQEIYNKANHLFNIGNYAAAREACQEILSRAELDRIRKLPEENTYKIIFKSTYFLLANIEAATHNTQQAVEIMERVMELSETGVFSQDTGAEAQVKIGHIYFKVGDYPTAIDAFQKVLDLYPESIYAKAARKKIDKTNELKVGEVRGKILLTDRKDHSGTTVSVFNGFSMYSTFTKADGSYWIPIYRSTSGTYISIFADRDNFIPQVINIVVEGKRSHLISEMTLLPTTNHHKGFLIGFCYRPIEGGKTEPHYGIYEYESNIEVKVLSDDEEYSIKSGENGSFRIILPSGDYIIKEAKKYVSEGVITIHRGRTSIFNLGLKPIMVD